MKNDNLKKNSLIALFFIAGACLGVGLVLLLLPDSWEVLFLIVALLAVSVMAVLFKTLIDLFLAPYLGRRKAALRALGREGIRIVHKDEVAKLAYKGIYYLLNGDFPKAEDYLQQSLAQSDVRQNQCFCVEWLIHLYETIENESKLTWGYRKAVELAPENPEAQSRLGHAYFNNGNLEKAEYCFEQALRYDANNGYAYFSLSKIYLIRGENEKAFETLQKLEKVNAQHPLCHAALADYYAMQGDRQKAEEECKKADLCGIQNPEELNKRINAMLSFHETEFSGEDLPGLYYRRIEKKDETEKTEKAEDTQ